MTPKLLKHVTGLTIKETYTLEGPYLEGADVMREAYKAGYSIVRCGPLPIPTDGDTYANPVDITRFQLVIERISQPM